MRPIRCLPALALLLFLPARADDGAVKTPPPGDGKSAQKMSCCAGEGTDKALCPKAKTKAKTNAKSAEGSKRPAPSAANMVVTRDTETGELRNATAAERAKLFADRAPQASGVAPRVIVLPDGTEMVELGEDTMNYAIATKSPDGSIKQSCVHGPDAASASRTTPKPAPAPRAEER